MKHTIADRGFIDRQVRCSKRSKRRKQPDGKQHTNASVARLEELNDAKRWLKSFKSVLEDRKKTVVEYRRAYHWAQAALEGTKKDIRHYEEKVKQLQEKR